MPDRDLRFHPKDGGELFVSTQDLTRVIISVYVPPHANWDATSRVMKSDLGFLCPMALGALRGPDIILRPGIPHEATSDAPLAPVVQPPEAASNDPSDQAGGTPKEISGEELAAAAAARAAKPEVKPEAKTKPETESDAGETDDAPVTLDVADPYTSEIEVVDKTAEGIRRQVSKERQSAREYRVALEAAAKAQIGDETWDKAVKLSRDRLIQQERERADRSGKEARQAKEEAEAARAEMAALRAKIPAPPEPPADLRPTRDQFEDPDAYDTALTSWGEREGTRKVEARLAEQQKAAEAAAKQKEANDAKTAQETATAKARSDWMAKVEKAEEKYPDYMDVTMADSLKISEPMAAAMMEADNGAEVAYFLGQNQDEAERIAGIKTVAGQMLAMGRLAEKIANPPRRRAAPPAAPIEPIDTNTTFDTAEVEDSMEAHYAKRTAAERAKYRPFFPQGGVH